MNFHGFEIVWSQRDLMLNGLLLTLEIVAISSVLAGLLGFAMFWLLIQSGPAVARPVKAVIDVTRAVPFMLLCYLIYYGLPSLGVTFGNITAGVTALTIYNAAYVAELLRGSWKAQPPEAGEAARALGFHGWRLLTRIILPPVVLDAVPMLGNQMIQVIKDSAFLVIITVQELTYAANEIQATYYVPFASFVCAILFYWILCLGVEGGVRSLLRVAEVRR
jgi:polar amino acid transport system permease protein